MTGGAQHDRGCAQHDRVRAGSVAFVGRVLAGIARCMHSAIGIILFIDTAASSASRRSSGSGFGELSRCVELAECGTAASLPGVCPARSRRVAIYFLKSDT